jgi:hypothetical protein
MPTNRRRRVRGLIDSNVQPWVADWLNGIDPPVNSEADIALTEWLFWAAPIAGLPPFATVEGRAAWRQHREAKKHADEPQAQST